MTIRLQQKAHALTLSVDYSTIYSFDRLGRLIGGFVDGVNFRRGLDNRILRKWSDYTTTGRARQRRLLTTPERKQFLTEMTSMLKEVLSREQSGEVEISGEPASAQEWLERCFKYDYSALETDAQKFHEIYTPVSILPPDQYYSLVLQITEGCSYNECSFCNFYQDRPFRIKSAEELKVHIDQVNKFFGPAMGLRPSVFLADANALIMKQSRLMEMLRIIQEHYTFITDRNRAGELHALRRQGKTVFNGIYSFIDLFTGEYKPAENFREMASLGVERVYIGMESGSRVLLEFLNKPGSKAEMVRAVNKVKSAGINVGVIVLIGAGGKCYAETHIQETASALNDMNLGGSDLIYFSDFFPQKETPYSAAADELNIETLSYGDMRNQEEAIRQQLQYSQGSGGPKITTYDIREFMY